MKNKQKKNANKIHISNITSRAVSIKAQLTFQNNWEKSSVPSISRWFSAVSFSGADIKSFGIKINNLYKYSCIYQYQHRFGKNNCYALVLSFFFSNAWQVLRIITDCVKFFSDYILSLKMIAANIVLQNVGAFFSSCTELIQPGTVISVPITGQ